jgi:hypothetical protein
VDFAIHAGETLGLIGESAAGALDVSVRAQIINQLEHLQRTLGVSHLFMCDPVNTEAFYLTLGLYDTVAVGTLPDDATMAKLALGLGAVGNVRTLSTTRSSPRCERVCLDRAAATRISSAHVVRPAAPSRKDGDMDTPQELTLEELRKRIEAAGLTIADHRLGMVRKLLSDALVHVRALDSRTIKTVEPAVRFEAGRE